MHRKKFLLFLVMSLIITAGTAGSVFAYSGYLTEFKNIYKSAGAELSSCSLCHGSSYSRINSYGKAYDKSRSYAEIENQDSDSDGFSNIDEIMARTNPGDAGSFPDSAAQIKAPDKKD